MDGISERCYMPINKYKCKDCGKEFSKIVISPEKAPSQCPVCGAPEPEEIGAAFNPDAKLAERLSCVSCDSCTEEAGCSAVRPS